MRRLFVYVLSMVFCIAGMDAAENGIDGLLKAIGVDSAECNGAHDVLLERVDQIGMHGLCHSDIAASVSLILRGREEAAAQALSAIIQNAVCADPAVGAAVDYLVEYRRRQGTDSEAYVQALRIKADYLCRVDSVGAEPFVELAEYYLAQGDAAAARRSLDISLAGQTQPDSAELLRIARCYSRLGGKIEPENGVPHEFFLLVVGLLVATVSALAVAALYFRVRWKKGKGAPAVAPSEAKGAAAMLKVALAASEKYREFELLTERKLAAGQTKDLYSSLNCGSQAAQYREAFFEAFDSAFLRTFPTFEQSVNSLLKEDRMLKFRQPLTPECRIAALMSLDVDDSTTLSQTLGLTLNTVYTYRNRLKGRAADRGSFEDNLRSLL